MATVLTAPGHSPTCHEDIMAVVKLVAIPGDIAVVDFVCSWHVGLQLPFMCAVCYW